MLIPDDLLPGDTLLYKRSGFFGWIISLRTGSVISHVEIFAGNGESVASRDGVGVGRYPFRTQGLGYVLRPATFHADLANKWFESVKGAKYSWIDLANFILPSVTVDSTGMFCSEFAVGYLRAGGVGLAHKEPTVKISPRDFRLFDALTEIWPEDTRPSA